ncbi:Panacea domain-containing protein [Flintibacter muris]|mgnify:CR=1 FL=1|uniref:Panacea domain-containing protein n=1 Tax=Flintibacter muris TaxID=2941327 RepID=UPI002042243D|nr:type II toxin-antitoxin system antitoxin SocA domain-containing protein [Flintibacter muris]
MVKIVDVAAYVVQRYSELTKERLDEMKLHKLLYFIQRESFAITGQPAFDGDFEGWKFGPVSRDVRNHYCEGEMVCPMKEVPDEIQYIANNVILEYGSLASWKLSELSHQETSWRNARIGLRAGENGSRKIKLEDIREDAKKVRPYDHVWDMYYDEFDDAQEEVVDP